MILFFYLLASSIIISSSMVVISRNTVYSVLWLIFTFCNAAGLLILIGAEYVAMTLVIVYVGAIAVLFIFIVMMLDEKLVVVKKATSSYGIMGFVILLMLLINLCFVIYLGQNNVNLTYPTNIAISPEVTNTHAIGHVLYTRFILPFQMVGIMLLAAMISCIILALRIRTGIKRQRISSQIQKNKANSLDVTNVPSNKGVKGLKYE